MMAAYDFATQLAKGEAAERAIDAHFARWFEIVPASRDEQRSGIDRWYTSKATGQRRAVEIKTDWRAAQTGNAFIETVSVGSKKRGWAYTSTAEVLLYYCPGSGGEQVYIVRFTQLRQQLAGWEARYRTVSVPNAGYVTRGVLVPLSEFERIASQVISL